MQSNTGDLHGCRKGARTSFRAASQWVLEEMMSLEGKGELWDDDTSGQTLPLSSVSNQTSPLYGERTGKSEHSSLALHLEELWLVISYTRVSQQGL